MPRALTDHTTALNAEQLLPLAQQYNGPFWAYDAQIIQQRIEQLRAFDVVRFAQKACSNIHILRLMRAAGVKVDSVSLGEIERALAAGFQPGGEEIVFTADVFDRPTLARIAELKVPVNAGSVDMLHQLGNVSLATRCGCALTWLRPWPQPENQYRRREQQTRHLAQRAPQALKAIEQYGLRLVGLHMHIGSGVDYGHLQQVCDAMVEQVIALGHDLEAISAGGGLSIPYRFGEEAIDTAHYFGLWDAARQRIAAHLGHPVKLEIEPGRFLVAESGVLVSQVRAVKAMGSRHFVLVDAGFSDLMRPSMYGSYHHISLLAGDGRAVDEQTRVDSVVAGPLCESGDVFTQLEGGKVETRALPAARVGDYLVFHDTGAYGASMSSNYNSRPLIPEVLFEQGRAREIRRAQTIQELLALELS